MQNSKINGITYIHTSIGMSVKYILVTLGTIHITISDLSSP
jgi:hypothetical protein